MDQISLQRANQLHPAVRADAIKLLAEAAQTLTGNASIRYAFTIRTFAEQTALYAQGRTTKGSIVTNAKAGYSFHNYGLAFDIVLLIDGKTVSWDTTKDYDGDHVADWQEFVKLAKLHGWAWGGDFQKFKDYPHFEKRFGYKEAELLAKYKAKDFIPGTEYVRI